MRRPPTWVIELVVIALIISTALVPRYGDVGRQSVAGFIVTILPATFLWARHRYPRQVLAACVALLVAAMFITELTPATLLATGFAMYALALRASRREAQIAVIVVLVITFPLAALATRGTLVDPLPVLVAVTVGFAASLGDSVRSRRAYIAELRNRVEVAEATRESEAARRVSEERLKIARDLHDVVAHQISVISLNAGVASASLETDPDQARRALATIRSASRRIIGDTGDLLAVLRSDDDNTRAPQPGLSDLPDLIEEFKGTGLAVTLRTEGAPSELPPVTGMVAYRILREALTNAAKHGADSRAHILLDYRPAMLSITVTNKTREPDGATGVESSGHGLMGIRELAASARGRANTDTHGGVFRLKAELPLRDVELPLPTVKEME